VVTILKITIKSGNQAKMEFLDILLIRIFSESAVIDKLWKTTRMGLLICRRRHKNRNAKEGRIYEKGRH